MQDKRSHKRYKLDVMELNSKIIFADKVEVLDISLCGIAIKADRRLNMDCEYLLRLDNKGEHISVKGVVVRSLLVGTEERGSGGRVPIYIAGLKFRDDMADLVANFLHHFSSARATEAAFTGNRRLSVRFHITTPMKAVLKFPAQYRVKVISLGGMLIVTDHALELESSLQMELSYNDENTISFQGRVASRQNTGVEGHPCCEIGIEFLDLREKDKAVLTEFIDHVSFMQL